MGVDPKLTRIGYTASTCIQRLPDYCGNLNAIAEARRVLLVNVGLQDGFRTDLGDIIAKRLGKHSMKVTEYEMIDSAASEQLEALLRAIGKYEESA